MLNEFLMEVEEKERKTSAGGILYTRTYMYTYTSTFTLISLLSTQGYAETKKRREIRYSKAKELYGESEVCRNVDAYHCSKFYPLTVVSW